MLRRSRATLSSSPFLHRRAATASTSSPSPSLYKPSPVGIFWDLRCKLPPKLRPLLAALRLRHVASLLGPLRLSLAFATSLPVLPPANAPDHLCPLCGRRFPDLPRHFHILHRREHAKRLRRLDSAKGARRIRLAASLAPKIDRYHRAVRNLSADSNTFVDDLRAAGILAATVPDAGAAVEYHAVKAVAEGTVGCVVLVSDDAGLEGAVRESRARGARAFVVGEDGVLRRCADAGLSWREVAGGKARERVAAAERRWKDGDLLRRLEWTYRPEEEEGRRECELEGGGGLDGGEVVRGSGLSSALGGKMSPGAWWELESDSASDR